MSEREPLTYEWDGDYWVARPTGFRLRVWKDVRRSNFTWWWQAETHRRGHVKWIAGGGAKKKRVAQAVAVAVAQAWQD